MDERRWRKINLSVAVQHHPSRAETVKPLLKALGPKAELVTDPEPDSPIHSPWRTYQECLDRTPLEATHRLIIQDDAEACPGFLKHARLALAARPDRIVVFHVSGAPATSSRRVLIAGEHDDSWAELDRNTWCPVVATCWPQFEIGPLLRFVEDKHYAPSYYGDDYRVGQFLRETHRSALATVPSLVEHPDLVPSLIGTKAMGGVNPGRVACCYIGDCDPASIDWDRGPR